MLLWIVLVWIIAAFPFALAVGRYLRKMDERHVLATTHPRKG